MFSPLNLFIEIVTGGIGLAYFIYGKKQEKIVMMIDGLVLMIYPYLFSNLFVLIAVGLVLIVIPFIFRGE